MIKSELIEQTHSKELKWVKTVRQRFNGTKLICSLFERNPNNRLLVVPLLCNNWVLESDCQICRWTNLHEVHLFGYLLAQRWRISLNIFRKGFLVLEVQNLKVQIELLRFQVFRSKISNFFYFNFFASNLIYTERCPMSNFETSLDLRISNRTYKTRKGSFRL